MATYNMYFQHPTVMDTSRSLIEDVYGINNVRVIDDHAFMPPYIQFTSTLLADEGIQQHVVRVLIHNGVDPTSFVIMKLLQTLP